MNRRSFLLGLLSTTAAPVVAKALPVIGVDMAAPGSERSVMVIRTGLPAVHWRKLYQGVPIREVDLIAEIKNIRNNWMIEPKVLPTGTKTAVRDV